MLTPPRDAQSAFGRLAPDLEEIADFIVHCRLTTPERMRLANLLADYFYGLAASSGRAGLRVVGDVDAPTGSRERPDNI